MITWSAHLSTLFDQVPLLSRPAAARDAGFSTVESWWPGDDLATPWADEVLRCGVGVTLINCYAGDLEKGDRGFLNVAERRDDVLTSLENAVNLARTVGAGRINLLVGRKLEHVPMATQRATAISVLRECGDLARDADLVVVVEPINEIDVPGSLVPTAVEAVDLIEAVGSPAVLLLYDAYHAARAGNDPISEVSALIDVIGHVQYADCPGRGAPGTGRVDLFALAESLDAAGYDGSIGLEYYPAGSAVRPPAPLDR